MYTTEDPLFCRWLLDLQRLIITPLNNVIRRFSTDKNSYSKRSIANTTGVERLASVPQNLNPKLINKLPQETPKLFYQS